MADLGLLSGVAEGLKQGLGSYMQVKQANDQSRQAAEDAALKKRMFDQQTTQKADEFEYQKTKDQSDLERQYKTGGFKKDESGEWVPDYGFLGAKASMDPNKQLLQALQMKKTVQDIESGDMRLKEAKLGKPEERQAGLYNARMQAAHEQAKKLEDSFKPESFSASAMAYLPEFLKPSELKQYENAKRNFVASVLRKESGAAISASEYDGGNKLYFPQAGDTKEVIEQKRMAREHAVSGMGLMAGPAKGLVNDQQPAGLLKSQPAAPQQQASTQENKDALNWALSNPQDPRAKRILQLNGSSIGTKF